MSLVGNFFSFLAKILHLPNRRNKKRRRPADDTYPLF